MINRVLIRMKVVQLLYSYLLTRSEFRIQPAPGPESTRDRQIAHSLYLDLLLLTLELAGQRVQDDAPADARIIAADKSLSCSPMAKSLSGDAKIREIILKGKHGVAAFNSALMPIYKAITASTAYSFYVKNKNHDLASDTAFWRDIILNIIPKLPEFVEATRARDEYSSNAVALAINMVCDTLASYNDTHTQEAQAYSDLEKSLNLAHDLYMALLHLAVELTDLQAERLEAAKHKYLPTHQDLSPDTRFIDNEFIKVLAANRELEEYVDNRHISFAENNEILLGSLLDVVIDSETYRNYMALPVTDYRTDCEFWRDLFKNVILSSDVLSEALEAQSVFWNDDLEIMGTFVLKTIKQYAVSETGGEDVVLQPKYKDEEDADFGSILFHSVIDNREYYRNLIDRFINSSQWDRDRLAFMDIVIMMTAIAELLKFPAIPVPVTVNEYVEIANSYSTPRSGHFVNGVLSSVINYLKSEGKLLKNIKK